MLDTQGIFYLVLSICVLWLTAFLCWALWYLIRILRQSNAMMEQLRLRMEQAMSFGGWLKSKLFASGASAISNMVSQAFERKLKKKK